MLAGIAAWGGTHLLIQAVWPDWGLEKQFGRGRVFTGREVIADLVGLAACVATAVVVLWRFNLAAEDREQHERQLRRSAKRVRRAENRKRRRKGRA